MVKKTVRLAQIRKPPRKDFGFFEKFWQFAKIWQVFEPGREVCIYFALEVIPLK